MLPYAKTHIQIKTNFEKPVGVLQFKSSVLNFQEPARVLQFRNYVLRVL